MSEQVIRPNSYNRLRPAFSLIEVMVSVIIISTVIAALLQLFSNNTHILGSVGQRVDDATRSTLLLGIGELGFENKRTTLDALTEAFELDDDLRRRIKSRRIELAYRADLQLGDDLTDTAKQDIDGETVDMDGVNETFVMEIGTSSLRIDGQQSSLIRMRLQ